MLLIPISKKPPFCVVENMDKERWILYDYTEFLDGRQEMFKSMPSRCAKLPLTGAYSGYRYISFAKLRTRARGVDRISIHCGAFELYELSAAEVIPETYVEASKLRSALRTWCFYSSNPPELHKQLQQDGLDASEIERLSRYIAANPTAPGRVLGPDDASRVICDLCLAASSNIFLRAQGLIETRSLNTRLQFGVKNSGYAVNLCRSSLHSYHLSGPTNNYSHRGILKMTYGTRLHTSTRSGRSTIHKARFHFFLCSRTCP